MKHNYNISPLKWAGSKAKMLPNLLPILNKHKSKTFAEPFVGAANVCINFPSDHYYLNDLNNDLMSTLDGMINNVDEFLIEAETYFDLGYDAYLAMRELFNSMTDSEKAKYPAHFLYLNKFCFNGLCRYNSKGKFNVAVGKSASTPVVPIKNIHAIGTMLGGKSTCTSLTFSDFMKTLEDVDECLIYCDPPYVPLTSNFKYNASDFNLDRQRELLQLAKQSKHTVVISNHWTDFTAELYADALETHVFDVQRTISCDGAGRKKVQECIVVF